MTQSHSVESFNYYLSLTYSAYDCYDLLKHFYSREFGIELISNDYLSPKDIDLDTVIKCKGSYSHLVDTQKESFTKVDSPRYGDVLLFNSWGIPAHVGIYIDRDYFLHTQKKSGACVERITTWQKRLLGYYRYDKDQAESIR